MTDLRRGFSLIEFLAVIAIVGVVCAIVLPAVVAARDAARRVQCTNNLKQMGLALHAYHGAVGSFPMGYVSSPSPDALATSPGWGWAALILSPLEQGPLYDSANFDVPVESPSNRTTRSVAVASFICPSDRDSGVYDVQKEGGGMISGFHTNSYAACFGAGIEIDASPDRGNGLFRRNWVVDLSQVRDGSGTTIALGERGACLVKTPWAGAPQGGISSFTVDGSAGGYDATGRGAELVVAHADVVRLNAPSTGPDDFYSPHASGANFLFADGSVRFVKETIHIRIYRALCTRDLGEIVDPNSF